MNEDIEIAFLFSLIIYFYIFVIHVTKNYYLNKQVVNTRENLETIQTLDLEIELSNKQALKDAVNLCLIILYILLVIPFVAITISKTAKQLLLRNS